jgi:hypothetical protein
MTAAGWRKGRDVRLGTAQGAARYGVALEPLGRHGRACQYPNAKV